MTSTYRKKTCHCSHGKALHHARRIDKENHFVACNYPGCKCTSYDPLSAAELAKEPQKRVENELPPHLSPPSENECLTVKINLWPLDKSPKKAKPGLPRAWTKGQVTNTETGEARAFKSGADLLSVLGGWKVGKSTKLREENS
jgi:hypothetical protein